MKEKKAPSADQNNLVPSLAAQLTALAQTIDFCESNTHSKNVLNTPGTLHLNSPIPDIASTRATLIRAGGANSLYLQSP